LMRARTESVDLRREVEEVKQQQQQVEEEAADRVKVEVSGFSNISHISTKSEDNNDDNNNNNILIKTYKTEINSLKKSLQEEEDKVVDLTVRTNELKKELEGERTRVKKLVMSSANRNSNSNSSIRYLASERSERASFFEHPKGQPLRIFELHALRYLGAASRSDAIFV